jgi:hypothetical protein
MAARRTNNENDIKDLQQYKRNRAFCPKNLLPKRARRRGKNSRAPRLTADKLLHSKFIF